MKRLFRRLQLQHVYYALAAFDILTVSLTLFLGHAATNIYLDSVSTSHEWTDLSQRVTSLGKHAAAVNAPGNNIFESLDPAGEKMKLDKAIANFNREHGAIEEIVERNRFIGPGQARTIRSQLNEIEQLLNAISSACKTVLATVAQDRGKAAALMAKMDRDTALIGRRIADLQKQISAFQRSYLDGEAAKARNLKEYEIVIALAILLMVVGVSLYGRRVARIMRETAADRRAYIRKLRRNERALRDSEQRSRSILEAVADGIIIVDPNGIIQTANPAVERIFGYKPEEIVGTDVRTLLVDHEHFLDSAHPYINLVEAFGAGGQTRYIEATGIRKGGAEFPSELSVAPMSSGHRLLVTGVVRDISTRRQQEEEIRRLAHSDVLTGLPNRAFFKERLNNAVSRVKRTGGRVGLLFLDLDGFKSVNDTHGHPIGDALLVEVARRLSELVRDCDTVARLGGDEFAIIVTGGVQTRVLHNLAKRLIQAVSEPVRIEGKTLITATSIGVSIFPDNAGDAEALITKADLALYQAKDAGRGVYRLFDEALHASVRDRYILEQDLRLGMTRGEFSIVFQPQVSIDGGVVVGAEALARWNHPTRGAVEPDTFIPLAEASGMIVPLGEQLLRMACEAAAGWPQPLPVAVNVTPRQFYESDFIETIDDILKDTGLAPERLEVELTESSMASDFDIVAKRLRRLVALGVSVTIDDFGTGYSSLARLKQFPVSRLKIDRSFVARLTEDGDNSAIVSTVITMADSLKMSVVAEGVETEDQRTVLAKMGCAAAQGFLFCHPVPNAEFIDWLDDREAGQPVRQAG